MATTMPWLPGWPATRLGRRAARARAIPAPSVPHFARGERVLLTLDRVVATDRALYCDGPEWVRLGWEQVTRADRHEHGMVVTAWAHDLPPRTVLAVERAARLLALARERVTWTTLLTTRVLVGGHPALVAARRQPGTGTLIWMVALASDVAQTPGVEAELAATIKRLRRELALP